jgi:hypothetical protein
MKQRATLKSGTGTSQLNLGIRASDVHFDEDSLSVDLEDGRTITVPLAWYPRLLNATPRQRANWELCAAGFGIHWPDVDEDLSTEGLLEGYPARKYQRSVQDKLRVRKRSGIVPTRSDKRIARKK